LLLDGELTDETTALLTSRLQESEWFLAGQTGVPARHEELWRNPRASLRVTWLFIVFTTPNSSEIPLFRRRHGSASKPFLRKAGNHSPPFPP
jgi:hypothetical protein